MDLNQFDIYCVEPFLALCDFKWNIVIIADTVLQPGGVDKYIVSTVIRGDETETFGFIEKFYFAFLHGILNKNE